MEEEKLACVFVNTNQPPREVKYLHCFKYFGEPSRPWELRFFELAEIKYPHPEAPDVANLTVMEWIEFKTKTPVIFRNYIDQAKEMSIGLKL